MGTTKSGRYLNTKGSAKSVSDYALVHSSEGTFTIPSKKNDELRLKSGGHGEKAIQLLNKYKIEYNIIKTYPNRVRVGNVPNHKEQSKRQKTNQVWFPKTWSNKDIKRAGEHVSSLKANRKVKNGTIIYGNYKGVRVGVIKTNGIIGTIFPDSNQSKVIRRKK
ncbi:MAG: EndoU domain-containing protein [Bacilli bacterium]|nr:EndoU domain-containing protein [Bacilli bacterium]